MISGLLSHGRKLALASLLLALSACQSAVGSAPPPAEEQITAQDREAMNTIAASLDSLARTLDAHRDDQELDASVMDAWLSSEASAGWSLDGSASGEASLESFHALLESYSLVLEEVGRFDGELPDDVQQSFDRLRLDTDRIRPSDSEIDDSLGSIRVLRLRERRCCIYLGLEESVLFCDGIRATRLGAWIYCTARAGQLGVDVQIEDGRCVDIEACQGL